MNKKETKSLKVFKNGFKKNEIVIYAIALMLVTAGYFNYTAENNSIETLAEQNFMQEEYTENMINASTNMEIAETINNEENMSTDGSGNIKSEESGDEDIGDVKLVSNIEVLDLEPENISNDEKIIENEKTKEADYFVSSKLERDTNYADMISTYKKILEDSAISETQKAIAMKEIKNINDTKNAISVCENLLLTKNFENFVVFVNNDSINIVVKSDDTLTTSQVAQIQNIVSREFNSKIEDIHITRFCN